MDFKQLLEIIKLLIPNLLDQIKLLSFIKPLFILTTLKNAFCIMIPLFIVSKFIDQKYIKMIFRNVGIICTLGMSKLPVMKDLWNSTIEAYVICGLCNLLHGIKCGLIEGLRSDNNPNDDNDTNLEDIDFNDIIEDICDNVLNEKKLNPSDSGCDDDN